MKLISPNASEAKLKEVKPKVIAPRAMGSGRWWALPATLGVLGFYALCVFAFLLIVFVLLLDVVAFIGLARFGSTAVITPSINALWRLLVVLFRSFNLKGGADYFLILKREDAPEIYQMMENLARRAQVSIPSEIVLEMTSGAWVHLKGYSHKSRSRLGIGYDLLAVLRPEELEAVLAHELAHAKLVQRGYRGWLLNGLSRISRQTEMVRYLIGEVRPAKRHFYLAEILSNCTAKIGKLVRRFAAEYSRRDEFAADRFGAEMTSPQAAQSALLQTYLADAGYKFSWKERAAHIERENGFAQWLRAQLFPPDEATREERRKAAMARKTSSEFDTHPPLAERLAALQNASQSESQFELNRNSSEGKWASDLLSEPDKIAAKLLQKIEEILQREEERYTKDAARWAKKTHRRSSDLVFSVSLMAVCAAMGLYMLALSLFFNNPWSETASSICIAALIVVGCAFWFRDANNYRAKLPVPIPNLTDWDAAIARRENEREANWLQAYDDEVSEVARNELLARREAMKTQMRLEAPTGKKREVLRFWCEQSYAALAKCDYERADIAADFCLEINPKNLEGQIARTVAGAFNGGRWVLENPLGNIIRHTGMSHSMNWVCAWALCLLGDWGSAEPYLLDALKRQPNESTLSALLALSQWNNDKASVALSNIRRVVKTNPENARARVLLLRLLVSKGRVKESEEHLKWLQANAGEDRDVVLSDISWNALRDETAEAHESAQKLLARDSSIQTRLRVARTLNDSNLKVEARKVFEEINAEIFCPEALAAISYADFEAKDYQAAKTSLLQAFDITRPAYPHRWDHVEWFATLLQGLSANENKMNSADSPDAALEETKVCVAWNADLDLGNRLSKLGVHRLQMLLYFPDENAARAQAQTIAGALCPHENAIIWNLSPAEKDDQPREPVVPGIGGHRWF